MLNNAHFQSRQQLPRCAQPHRRLMEPAGPLRALAARVMRFGEINHAIGDISKQMLSRTLKRLEQGGFVKRTLFAEIPPRVEYELTALGRSILAPLEALVAWADANHQSICNARRDYADGDAA